jgi:hypothetical protein
MEIFVGCYRPMFRDELYPKIESMQQLLGDINDSRQIVARLTSLRKEMKKHRAPGDPEARGVGSVLRRLRREHDAELRHRHRKFLAWWEELDAEALFIALLRETGE